MHHHREKCCRTTGKPHCVKLQFLLLRASVPPPPSFTGSSLHLASCWWHQERLRLNLEEIANSHLSVSPRVLWLTHWESCALVSQSCRLVLCVVCHLCRVTLFSLRYRFVTKLNADLFSGFFIAIVIIVFFVKAGPLVWCSVVCAPLWESKRTTMGICRVSWLQGLTATVEECTVRVAAPAAAAAACGWARLPCASEQHRWIKEYKGRLLFSDGLRLGTFCINEIFPNKLANFFKSIFLLLW